MHTAPHRHWFVTLGWVALLLIALLVVTAGVAAIAPLVLEGLGVLLGLMFGFAVLALPFATVVGIVLLITRSNRRTAPAMYGYPPSPGLQGGPGPGSGPYPPAPQPPSPAAGPLHGAPAPVPAPARSRRQPNSDADLQPRLQALLARIHDKAAALRDPRQWHLVPPEDQVHLDRVLGEYLPAILNTYRGIPRGAEDWPVRDGGPSVIDVVEHQLRLLEQSLDAIAERVFKTGAAQLLAQQQFLEDRLGEGPQGELTIR
jgi:hypothetical protein